MLFLYRPPQTYMPYSLPRNRMQQAEYNETLQDHYRASLKSEQGVAEPEDQTVARLRQLAELHAAGALTDDEFATAKAKVLGPGTAGS